MHRSRGRLGRSACRSPRRRPGRCVRGTGGEPRSVRASSSRLTIGRAGRPPGRQPARRPRVSASPAAAPQELAWAPIDATGPAAREDHTWTVDPGRATAYLFGGRDGSTSSTTCGPTTSETDAWDGAVPAVATTGDASATRQPGCRTSGSSSSPARLARPSSTTCGPTTRPRTRGRRCPSDGDVPVPRYGSCSAVGRDGRLWISHGFTSDGVRFADTRAYDFGSGTWTDETPAGAGPVERCLHACWLTDAGELALYAGQTTGVPGARRPVDALVRSVGRDDRHAPTRSASWPRTRASMARRSSSAASPKSGPLADAWLLPDGALRCDGAPPDGIRAVAALGRDAHPRSGAGSRAPLRRPRCGWLLRRRLDR